VDLDSAEGASKADIADETTHRRDRIGPRAPPLTKQYTETSDTRAFTVTPAVSMTSPCWDTCKQAEPSTLHPFSREGSPSGRRITSFPEPSPPGPSAQTARERVAKAEFSPKSPSRRHRIRRVAADRGAELRESEPIANDLHGCPAQKPVDPVTQLLG
jgi:hypothetical protein